MSLYLNPGISMASSNEIKQWLVEHHQANGVATRASEWKRLKKSKNADGHIVREFYHPTVGKVTVMETPAGLVMSPAGPAPAPAFTTPVFTPASLAAASAVLNDYRRALWEDQEKERASSEWLRKQPLFLEAFPALPAQFTFSFPADTYGNEGGGNGVDGDATELCILVKEKDQDDPHYMTVDLIGDRLRALDMEAEDEYHWALQTGPTTVRQWVSRLLGLGLVYDPTDCIMATELLALGADRPAPGPRLGPTRAVHAQFQKAIRTDDVVTIASLLGETDAEGKPVEWNDGSEQTWVESAFENRAWNALSLLLAADAPVASGSMSKVWEYHRPWHEDWQEDPARTQSVLQLLALSNGWNPEGSLTPQYQRFDERGGLERDAWAKTVVMGPWTSEHAQWVGQAWDLLAERVGEGHANDSFTRAWFTMRHTLNTQGFTERLIEGLRENPAPLHAWPSRTQPRPWQALATLASHESSFDWASGLAKQLGVDLPTVVCEDGQTVLEHARQKAGWAKERTRRDQGGFTIVLKYADGTTRTQDQENRMAWRKAQRVVDALESWGTVASGGPKPGR